MSIFTGSCVALVTPFKDGKVDFERFHKLIDWQIENKTDAILIAGTTGAGFPAYVTVNNKAEGSAPLSVLAPTPSTSFCSRASRNWTCTGAASPTTCSSAPLPWSARLPAAPWACAPTTPS